jgi:hypothetical protein
MLVHAWNRGAAIMCITNTKGIDHVIPVMLDTKGDVIFGPLHGRWEKEHIQQARRHLSYILINSRNYASGKDQIQAAWAAKFSARNLREYGDGFQGDQATPSEETQSEDDNTLQEDLDTDSQYVWQDDDKLNAHDGTDEEMKDDEIHGLEMDSVFLSLVQDFGKKRLKEPWVAVGAVLRAYTHPRSTQPPLKQPPLETQFIIILKGIGVDTYECLKNNLQEPYNSTSNNLRDSVRRYLKELMRTRVDYVDMDKRGTRKGVAAMQNIPLVYGDSMLGSDNWMRLRPVLQDGWRAEQEANSGVIQGQQSPTDVGEDLRIMESMDEVERV